MEDNYDVVNLTYLNASPSPLNTNADIVLSPPVGEGDVQQLSCVNADVIIHPPSKFFGSKGDLAATGQLNESLFTDPSSLTGGGNRHWDSSGNTCSSLKHKQHQQHKNSHHEHHVQQWPLPHYQSTPLKQNSVMVSIKF